MSWFRKNNRFTYSLVWIAVYFFLMPGCGYTLRHRLKDSFAKAKNGVHIPVFVNYTDEVGAEVVFTNALIRELQSRGEVLIKSKKESALELKGQVEYLYYNPTAYTAPGYKGLQSYRRLPTEIGVNATVLLKLIDTGSGRVLWEKRFFGFKRVSTSVSRTYNYEAPSSFGLLTQSVVASSYSDIARDIMRDVYDDMVELF